MPRRQARAFTHYGKPWLTTITTMMMMMMMMMIMTMLILFAQSVRSEQHTSSPPIEGRNDGYPTLAFPETFHLTFIARERSSKDDARKEQYHGTVSRESNGEVSSVVTATNVQFAHLNPMDRHGRVVSHEKGKEAQTGKTKQSTFIYRNGQMLLDGDCVPDVRNVPPVIPDFDKHLLDNAVPLVIADYPLTYDREINMCIAKQWHPWVVTYHGEPFVVCIDHIEAAKGINRIAFVPKRIIGSTTTIEIIDFRPNATLQDLTKMTENALLEESAGACRKAMLGMRRNDANGPEMTNVVSESVKMNSANNHGSTYPGTLMHRLKRAYGLSRLALRTQGRNSIDESVIHARSIHRNDLRLFWFYDYVLSCKRDWIRDDDVCRMVEQANDEPTKTCIFLHGVGQADEDRGNPAPTFPDYWGDIEAYTSHCKERVFIREETKKRGWDNIDLQKSYCNVALSNQPEGDTVIRNKILYVHSMGNLILAGAIKNKICDIDTETTTWYDIQGPFNGSKAATTLKEICLAVGAGWTEPVPALYYYIASKGGYCVPGTNQTFEAYHTLDPSYPGLSALYPAVADKINGFLCGDSPFGLYSMYSPLLEILSRFVNYGEDSDGMVPVSSCNPGNIDPRPDYQQSHYLGSFNHADGTCRNGDGRWGSRRKPCSTLGTPIQDWELH